MQRIFYTNELNPNHLNVSFKKTVVIRNWHFNILLFDNTDSYIIQGNDIAQDPVPGEAEFYTIIKQINYKIKK